MGSTASGVNAITSMGQRRMLDTVRNVANLLRKLLRRQLKYSMFFLDDDEWMRITGMQKPQGKLGKDFDIKIDLITDAQKDVKISQFNLMLQNMQYIGEGVRFEVGNLILAKYFDLFDEPTIAEAIKNQQPPQPDPMQQQMQQLEMQKTQSEAKLKEAQSQKAMAEAQGIGSDAQNNVQESQASMMMEQEKARQQMLIEQRKSEQQMELHSQKAGMSMLIQRHKAANDIAISNQKKKAGANK
jgi:hypothetical protein